MATVSPLQRISLTAGLTVVPGVPAVPKVGPQTAAEKILALEVAKPADGLEPAQPGARGPAAPAPNLPSPTARSVVAQATQAAVARQTGLAPLMADLAEAARSPSLPPQVRAAAAQALALRTPLTPALQGSDLQAAMARSGVMMESHLAEGVLPTPQNDLKAALLALRSALAGLLADAPRPTAAARGRAPPPPYRGGPMQGQPAEASMLPAEPHEAAARLLGETEGALARQQLLQAGSLPQQPDAGGPASRWLFEIPFAMPNGASVGQFEIGRDPPPAGSLDGEPIWRARFSLDLAPLGPLHAHVSLTGGHVGVALWAQGEAGLSALRRRAGDLSKALQAARLTSDIAIYPGQPAAAAATPGHFVDKAL